MTVQGPVKKHRPDGMSHGGRGGCTRAYTRLCFVCSVCVCRKDLAYFLFQWPDDFALVISAVPWCLVFIDGALPRFSLIPFTKCVCVWYSPVQTGLPKTVRTCAVPSLPDRKTSRAALQLRRRFFSLLCSGLAVLNVWVCVGGWVGLGRAHPHISTRMHFLRRRQTERRRGLPCGSGVVCLLLFLRFPTCVGGGGGGGGGVSGEGGHVGRHRCRRWTLY